MIFLRKLHKWLGLLVGIQLLLWTASGLMFAWLDHHEVAAEHSAQAPEPAEFSPGMVVAEPSTWLDEYRAGEVYEVRLTSLLDQWVWRVEAGDRVELRRAEDGKPLKLDEALVQRLAQSHYVGDGRLQEVAFQATPTLETREAGPVWQAKFDDAQRTALYFSADDGRLIATRNSTWRLFDFFWMLHTMDYQGRDNFNNPVVITAGTGALWLALSGLFLLTRSFRRQDFDLVGRCRRGRSALRIVNAKSGNQMDLRIHPSGNLFAALAGAGVELPSNCGGGGSCGLCVVQFRSVAPKPVQEERALLSSAALEAGMRLACRHYATEHAQIEVPDAAMTDTAVVMQVTATRFLTPFIKELTLRPVNSESVPFRAGSYVQVEVPAGAVNLAKFAVPVELQAHWSRLSLPATTVSECAVRRAYSMANFPGESNHELRFNVRFAPPPESAPDAPCGRGAAYIFALHAGDRVRVRGPFGTFCDTGGMREKVFIGGGAGMAPLRSIVLDTLRNRRSTVRISFWYGARGRGELFYFEDFEQLARDHANFSWHVALSDAGPEDEWTGPRGYIHEVMRDLYLNHHPGPTACEYYLCGPPPMLRACQAMLHQLGVPVGQIFFDDFGI